MKKLLKKCTSLLVENFELKQKNASLKMRFLFIIIQLYT